MCPEGTGQQLPTLGEVLSLDNKLEGYLEKNHTVYLYFQSLQKSKERNSSKTTSNPNVNNFLL